MDFTALFFFRVLQNTLFIFFNLQMLYIYIFHETKSTKQKYQPKNDFLYFINHCQFLYYQNGK